MRSLRLLLLSSLAAIQPLTGSAAPAAAPPAGRIAVEFNDLQPADGGCRAVFVAHNGLDKAVDKLTLRVVAFDGKGRASLFLSLDIGVLPIDKTRVLRFDLGKGVNCSEVSRLVLDDVTDCAGGNLRPADCLSLISTSSRTDVPFTL